MNNKNIVIISLLALGAYGAVEYDLRKGIDLTGVSRVSGSQINQTVDAGTIADGKGLTIRGITKPDVTYNPRYTNFLWLDTSAGVPGTLRQYVCCGDDTTNWTSTVAGVLSIESSQLANNSVVSNKLGTNSVFRWNIATNQVSRDQLIDGEVINAKLGSGAVGLNSIANNAVGNGQLTNDAVRSTNIVDGTIVSADIASETITSGNILNATITGTDVATGTITTNNLAPNVATNLFTTIGLLNVSSTASEVLYSVNVASVVATNNGAFGYYHVLFTSPYANTNYVAFAMPESSSNPKAITIIRKFVGGLQLSVYDLVVAGFNTNVTKFSIICSGAQ